MTMLLAVRTINNGIPSADIEPVKTREVVGSMERLVDIFNDYLSGGQALDLLLIGPTIASWPAREPDERDLNITPMPDRLRQL